MTRLLTSLAAASLVGLVLLAGPAAADEVLLKNGRKIEGTVTERAGGYEIKTDSGITMTIPKDQVASITKGLTKQQEYYERAEAIDEGDTAARMELARWCGEHDLATEAAFEYGEVLKAEPDNEEAHRALDHVKHKGVWISREQYMASLGFVRHKGRYVSEDDYQKAVDEELGKKVSAEVVGLIRDASATIESPVREKARAALDGYKKSLVVKPLLHAMRMPDKDVRRFAAGKLGEVGDEDVVKPLAKLATEDRYNTVRLAALHSLKSIDHPQTVEAIAPALFSNNPYHRINAMSAMNVFPSRRGVYWLIRKLRHETGGFDRVHVAFTTQRAFIRDYEVTAGGTGLAIAEVADPIVDVFTDGVILDVKIRRVEWETTVAVLKGLTGVSYGGDVGAWSGWWKKNGATFAVQDPLAKDDSRG